MRPTSRPPEEPSLSPRAPAFDERSLAHERPGRLQSFPEVRLVGGTRAGRRALTRVDEERVGHEGKRGGQRGARESLRERVVEPFEQVRPQPEYVIAIALGLARRGFRNA